MRPLRRTKLFFDGGCRPNPGLMECAVVLRGHAHYRHDLGEGTNSDAEWLAALYAVEIAQRHGERNIILLGDSTLVVTQANGLAPCRSASLAAHRQRLVDRLSDFDTVRIRYIGRAQNLAGIALAKLHSR
jgi:ribonuclease HI